MDGRDVLVRGFYRRRLFAIVKCAAVAKKRGYRAFAVQHQGWCATGPRAHVTYRKYGRSTKCRNGKGGPWANDVYFLSGIYLRKSGWGRMFLNQFSVLTRGLFLKNPETFRAYFGCLSAVPWFFFAQARAESELHHVTAAFFRSSTKDVVTTGVHERTIIGLGAPSHLTTIGTENGATVLVNVFLFCFFAFCLFVCFHVFTTSVSFTVMRDTPVRFHTITLNITGCSILARSAKWASMCYGKETEPCLKFVCTTFQTGPFEFLRL